MTVRAYEVNFDGLVGPTHNYAGLSRGNTASQEHAGDISNPKAAALEGLAKMKLMADLGLQQAVLPPQERPELHTLRRLGFEGDNQTLLAHVRDRSPALLAVVCSASGMWTANAATVSPSADTHDGRVHFTVANLTSQPHRWIEPPTTAMVLRTIFNDNNVFAHHDPLPSAPWLADEGAANHMRLGPNDGTPGIEVFVYGQIALDRSAPAPRIFPARQTLEASAAVARLHGLNDDRVVWAGQNPAAVDAGVFHNDVIAVSNGHVLLYHSDAWINTPQVIGEVKQKYARACGADLICIEVTGRQLSVADAVQTYLFNSQLVNLPDGDMCLVCPSQCQHHQPVQQVIQQILQADNPVASVRYVAVRQSMKNGGGPACLRLRVTLTQEQMDRSHEGVVLTPRLYDQLTAWVNRHYRDRLAPADLADPQLVHETRAALDALTQILALGSIYPFQQADP